MIDYELIRSDRRSLSLAVRDGRPLVRAPRRLAKREIDRFVAAHEDWIKAQLERARPIQAEISPEEEKRLRNAARIKQDVEVWINTIPVRMQRIIRYRIFDELPWNDVAVRMGRRATAESVKKEYQRFMEMV